MVEIDFEKCKGFSELQRPRDLDLESGHTAYRHASLINLYVHTKFHWNWTNFLWTDVRTDVPTDRWTFPPLMLLRRLGGIDLKIDVVMTKWHTTKSMTNCISPDYHNTSKQYNNLNDFGFHQPALMKLRMKMLKLSDNASDIVVVSDVKRDVISPAKYQMQQYEQRQTKQNVIPLQCLHKVSKQFEGHPTYKITLQQWQRYTV